jgi:hypothetical protein
MDHDEENKSCEFPHLQTSCLYVFEVLCSSGCVLGCYDCVLRFCDETQSSRPTT